MTTNSGNSICFQCNNEINDPAFFTYSCSHTVCCYCLYNNFLASDLQELNSTKTLTLFCPNDSGFLTLPISKLVSIICSKSPNPDTSTCTKHNLKFENYCSICKIWLCSQCKELFHNEYFKNHPLTEGKWTHENQCVFHNTEKTTLFCWDCNCEICNLCSFKSGTHFEHRIVTISDYINEFNKTKNCNSYDNFTSFDEVIQDKLKRLDDDIELEINKCNTKFEELINMIQEIQQKYIDELLEQQNNAHDMFTITNKIFEYFYSAVEKEPNTKNIKYFKDWNTKFKETKVFSNIITDVTGNIKAYLENTKASLIKDLNNSNPFIYKLNFQSLRKSQIFEQTPQNASSRGDVDLITNKPIVKCETPYSSFIGHKGSVFSIYQLADGNIISGGGSGDNSLKIWSITDNKCSQTIKGFSWGLWACIQLQDQRICTGAGDNNISIWDPITFKNWGEIYCHNDIIRSLYQLSNPDYIWSSSDDTTIKICNVKEMKSVASLSGHTKSVTRAIEWSDGRIASSSKDKTVKIWDQKTLKCVSTLKGHTAGVNYIYEWVNTKLASCSDDFTICLWDVFNSWCTDVFQGHSGPVNMVIQCKDGRMASASKDCKIKLWNISKKKCVYTLNAHKESVHVIYQMANGHWLSGSRDMTIKEWDLAML